MEELRIHKIKSWSTVEMFVNHSKYKINVCLCPPVLHMAQSQLLHSDPSDKCFNNADCDHCPPVCPAAIDVACLELSRSG